LAQDSKGLFAVENSDTLSCADCPGNIPPNEYCQCDDVLKYMDEVDQAFHGSREVRTDDPHFEVNDLNVMFGKDEQGFFAEPISRPSVRVSCQEWEPKPFGCWIEDGKDLDDLVAAITDK
jgi:hypothetical protein